MAVKRMAAVMKALAQAGHASRSSGLVTAIAGLFITWVLIMVVSRELGLRPKAGA